MCPADGRVLHLGKVEENGRLEQIKGMTYPLHRFLGEKTLTTTLDLQQGAVQNLWGEEDRELFHVTIYLAPGDYHGFHSPADWIANTRRHFPGKGGTEGGGTEGGGREEGGREEGEREEGQREEGGREGGGTEGGGKGETLCLFVQVNF